MKKSSLLGISGKPNRQGKWVRQAGCSVLKGTSYFFRQNFRSLRSKDLLTFSISFLHSFLWITSFMAIPTFLLVLSDPSTALLASSSGFLNCIFTNYEDAAWDLWLIYLPESSRQPLTGLKPRWNMASNLTLCFVLCRQAAVLYQCQSICEIICLILIAEVLSPKGVTGRARSVPSCPSRGEKHICVTARDNSAAWNTTVVTRPKDQYGPRAFCKGHEAAPQTSKPCCMEAVRSLS